MGKNISFRCSSIEELLHYLTNPNPSLVYVFMPKGFKLLPNAEDKIFKIFEKENDCIVFGDMQINKNGKIIPQLYPSYNIEMNLTIDCPIYVKTSRPIGANTKNPSEVFGILLKQIIGIHIPDILFECHQ